MRQILQNSGHRSCQIRLRRWLDAQTDIFAVTALAYDVLDGKNKAYVKCGQCCAVWSRVTLSHEVLHSANLTFLLTMWLLIRLRMCAYAELMKWINNYRMRWLKSTLWIFTHSVAYAFAAIHYLMTRLCDSVLASPYSIRVVRKWPWCHTRTVLL